MDERLYPVLMKHEPRINGLIYQPDRRNLELRFKIDNYMTIHDSRNDQTLLSGITTVRPTSGSAICFLVTMVAILGITLMFL